MIEKTPCHYVRMKPRFVGDSLQEVLDGKKIPAEFIFSGDIGDPKSPFQPFEAPWAGIGTVILRQ